METGLDTGHDRPEAVLRFFEVFCRHLRVVPSSRQLAFHCVLRCVPARRIGNSPRQEAASIDASRAVAAQTNLDTSPWIPSSPDSYWQK